MRSYNSFSSQTSSASYNAMVEKLVRLARYSKRQVGQPMQLAFIIADHPCKVTSFPVSNSSANGTYRMARNKKALTIHPSLQTASWIITIVGLVEDHPQLFQGPKPQVELVESPHNPPLKQRSSSSRYPSSDSLLCNSNNR